MCVFQEETGLYNLGIFVLWTTTQTKAPKVDETKIGTWWLMKMKKLTKIYLGALTMSTEPTLSPL